MSETAESGAAVRGEALGRRLAQAEALCRERGVRFTPLRRRVFESLIARGAPAGAYELLADLREAGFADAPPTVYRALDFLRSQGLAHRVRSTNAFVACDHPGDTHTHGGVLLICRDCGHAAEIDHGALGGAVREVAAAHGFEPASQLIEVSGRCRRCRRA
ncbi:Fur family transcriptional regulator [Acidihalobacter prosperus]|uniref:Zinc uptake regulation protein ZUR n=1 Tax=Acidihalobacter prosperus TaxID=160660 RepID=A0A1A6C1T6_9GAMM|nr:Fur family transcriptional regulator [Acidihalobacter prosperus]OBS08518.1 Zinc uptake regulation protein ZUR [Acidihalobacter prosperus]